MRLIHRLGPSGAMRLAQTLGRQPLDPCAGYGMSRKRQQGNLGLRLGDRQKQITDGFESPVAGRLQPARNFFRSATDSSGNLGPRQHLEQESAPGGILSPSRSPASWDAVRDVFVDFVFPSLRVRSEGFASSAPVNCLQPASTPSDPAPHAISRVANPTLRSILCPHICPKAADDATHFRRGMKRPHHLLAWRLQFLVAHETQCNRIVKQIKYGIASQPALCRKRFPMTVFRPDGTGNVARQGNTLATRCRQAGNAPNGTRIQANDRIRGWRRGHSESMPAALQSGNRQFSTVPHRKRSSRRRSGRPRAGTRGPREG